MSYPRFCVSAEAETVFLKIQQAGAPKDEITRQCVLN